MHNINKIYCDFDGTITTKDVVNEFYKLYADKKWIESEKLWCEGKISSRENTTNQVGMLSEVSPIKLSDFINSVELTEGFIDFYNYLKENHIELIILSDGFDMFIQMVLKRFGINDIKIYANHLIYENNKFKIEFPYYTDKCKKKSGMCKCSHINENNFAYIGDGTSDLCVASKANILFATKSLKKYCDINKIKHFSFNSFNDILKYIK